MIRTRLPGKWLFLFYPILLVPYYLKRLLKGDYRVIIYLSLFIGLWAYLVAPTGDLYRYQLDFYFLQGANIAGFMDYMEEHVRVDLLFYVLVWILGKMSIPFDYSRFIFGFVGCYLFLTLIYQIVYSERKHKKTSIKELRKLAIMMLLIISFRTFIYRNGLAIVIMGYGLYQFYYLEKKRLGIILFLIACLLHSSMLVFSSCVLFQSLIRFKGNYYLSLSLIILGLFASFDIVTSLIEKLPFSGEFVNHFLIYTEGYYASEFLQDHSFRYYLGTVLPRVGLYSLYYFYLKFYEKNEFSGFLTLVLAIMVIIAPFAIVRRRFEQFAMYVFLINYSYQYLHYLGNKRKRIRSSKRRSLNIMMVISVFLAVISIWSSRREIIVSNESNIIYPSLYILSNEYDKTWINNNIVGDGDFKHN